MSGLNHSTINSPKPTDNHLRSNCILPTLQIPHLATGALGTSVSFAKKTKLWFVCPPVCYCPRSASFVSVQTSNFMCICDYLPHARDPAANINFLQYVCSDKGCDGPLFTDCTNFCRVCSRFSLRHDTCFWCLFVRIFSQQFWLCALRTISGSPFQTRLIVRFDTWINRETAHCMAMACPNMRENFCYSDTRLYLPL